MTALVDLSASELLSQLTAGKVSSVEATRAYLDRIAKFDGAIHAFLSTRGDLALDEAKKIDERRTRGETLGPLAGLPVAVKDLLCTRGEVTTCASRMLEHFRPPYDATIITKLKQADAVIVGKTNMDEFAMGGSNENSAFGPTRNPWDVRCIPGGSSGGAAACIAAQMAPLSVGSDTGGSIRQPSGLCGVSGLKPTYGRVSRYGLVAFASSLDQLGPIAGSAEDVAILLQAMAGHDPLDSTSVDVAVPDYRANLPQPLKGLRIGIAREHFGPGLDSEVEAAVREAVQVFTAQGATVKELSLPNSKYAVATYYVIAPCEASSNLARYDAAHYGYRCDEKTMLAELAQERKALRAAGNERGLQQLDSALVRMYRRSRAEAFGTEVKRRIMLGSYALSAGYYDAYYLKALKVRRLIRQDFDAAFRDIDVLLGPVTANAAFPIGEKSQDPLAMYLVDLFTVSANLAGICGMSVPCGFTAKGLPIGLQLQAAPFQEPLLLRAAHQYQLATDWHTRRPKLAAGDAV
jgi:aspartyl-tRNA(Asn)/glutamyl-tRNA(Gln) amidotransferase subunit A